jgi:secreted trypsin-like serine protease
VNEESLKYAENQVLNHDECRFDFGDLFVDENRICLNSKEGTGTPCLGDAGGPMVMVESGDGEATLVGVLSSFNENFCETGEAAIYMRTSQYLDWIELNAGVSIRP